MFSFIELKPETVRVSDTARVVKHGEYTQHLNAQGLIDAANRKADAIVEEAEARAQDICDASYQKGLKLARQDQSEAMLATLESCRKYIESQKAELISLALAAAQKVIGELATEERVLALLGQALSHYYNEQSIRVHVSSDDIDQINAQVLAIKKRFPGISQLSVCEDDRIAPGDCLLETPVGTVDASADTQLSAIAASMQKVAEEAP